MSTDQFVDVHDEVTIRRARPGDGEQLYSLWVALAHDGAAADDRYQLRSDAEPAARQFITERWLDPDGDRPVWVAEQGAHLVGFIAVRPGDGGAVLDTPPTLAISDLYVGPNARRAGVGRRLFAAAHQHAESVAAISLEVGTLALDHRAVAFWRAMGFGDWRVTLQRPVDASP
ncbi:MAG: GNAT family N-acetyltransferase [Actinomycetota bacterium]